MSKIMLISPLAHQHWPNYQSEGMGLTGLSDQRDSSFFKNTTFSCKLTFERLFTDLLDFLNLPLFKSRHLMKDNMHLKS